MLDRQDALVSTLDRLKKTLPSADIAQKITATTRQLADLEPQVVSANSEYIGLQRDLQSLHELGKRSTCRSHCDKSVIFIFAVCFLVRSR